jgi:ribosomal protein S18 acetylase RimI-like enzyme
MCKIGLSLVDTAVSWASDRQAKSLHLLVAEGNESAIELFKKALFSIVGEVPYTLSGKKFRFHRMERRL